MDFRGINEFLKDTSKYIILIIIVLVLAIYVVSLQQIIGPSMSPTLNENDVVILDKLRYKIVDIKRNDIVVFDYEDTKYLVKRVIGLPGETIAYKDNVLYINGEAYFEEIEALTNDFDLKDLGYEVIPEDMYLVLGDNRTNSLDSREIGLIKKSEIRGKAFIRIWPINKIKFL